MAGKVKRLSKVARELNVGISTIVDYMKSQGVELESSPNTKIQPEHFEILSVKFAADQSLKEAAKKTAVKREERKTITLNNPEPEKEVEEEVKDAPEIAAEEEKAAATIEGKNSRKARRRNSKLRPRKGKNCS
jgi:hypothetical protein